MTATMNTAWYDLFSRGARDWLRHNDKVREAVQQHLPELIAGPDLITGPQDRTVQVPVRLLEHARFKLADARSQTGAGQGEGQGDRQESAHERDRRRAAEQASGLWANTNAVVRRRADQRASMAQAAVPPGSRDRLAAIQ